MTQPDQSNELDKIFDETFPVHRLHPSNDANFTALKRRLEQWGRDQRIDELEKQHVWIMDFDDDIAFNLEERIDELKALKENQDG